MSRRGSTAETLAGLRPIVKPGGIVTAGNSSSLNDGASAVVVASGEAVARYGLTPRARIVTSQTAGVPPEVMGIGPVPATRKVLARTGLSVGDLGAVELNEAFATQSLATDWQEEWVEEKRKLELSDVTDFDSPTGKGALGKVEGRRVVLGSASFLGSLVSQSMNSALSMRLAGEGGVTIFAPLNTFTPAGCVISCVNGSTDATIAGSRNMTGQPATGVPS